MNAVPNQESPSERFRTYSVKLGAYLRMQGIPVRVSLDSQGQSEYDVADTETVREFIQRWELGTLVNPKAFLSSFYALKNEAKRLRSHRRVS